MNRQPVTSTNIKSVGFELTVETSHQQLERGTLEVEFHPTKKGGSCALWRYYDVPVTLYTSLLAAPSIGSFFHKAVRMGEFRSEKIELRDLNETDALYRSWDRESLLGMRAALLRDQAALPTEQADDVSGENAAWFTVRLSLIDRIMTENGWTVEP